MSTIIRILSIVVLAAAPALAQARLLDIVDVEGVRTNQIRGLGLVVGLNGTGDKSLIARQMASNVVRRLGVNASLSAIPPDNMAVVMVTATIPPFARPGSKIDVTISSMGDAESLRGGTLLATQLNGFDGRTVYAIAEGPLATGALSATGNSGSKEIINHPTVGRIPGGANVERAIPQKMVGPDGKLRLLLRQPDYRSATNVAKELNTRYPGLARPIDASTIEVSLPSDLQRNPVAFLNDVGDLRIQVANKAIVVINERNGTIVAGNDVVVLPVAIAHANLSISVRESFDVSQPAPFARRGDTVVTPESEVAVNETGTEMRVLPQSVSAGELAQALNSLGVSPLDLITIFQMLKAQGALQAELVLQ